MGEAVTAVWRPPETFVHGINGPVVIVPDRVAAWLERHTDLRKLRTAVRGADAEVDSVLVAISLAAQMWRASVSASAVARPAQVAAPSRMSTTEAADLIGITASAVRLAVAEHRLPAERVAGRWLISREAVEHYRAGRAA